MLKRAFALFLSIILLTLAMPATALCYGTGASGEVYPLESEDTASGDVYAFGDRILYGGTAVDVGDSVVTSENGALYLDGVEIAGFDAKYLNYFDGMLWFIAENRIYSCGTDGSDVTVLRDFGENTVTHLYVVADGMYYLVGDTVFACFEEETAVLTREGIRGFVPLDKNRFRWVKDNPDYVASELSGDEVYSDGASEYLSFITDESGIDEALGSDVSVCSDGDSEYSGPYVQVGETTLPLAEHMPGTFFSKNGKACTCHNTSSNYCIESVGNCNCMRYYPTGYKESCEIDLLGAQCFAFARLVFYKCFGFIDHSMNDTLYYNVGSLARGAVTENSIRSLMMSAAPGAHVRLSQGHSVSILSMDSDFIVIYHGNAGGDGVATQSCVVSTRRYTWAEFATAVAAGVQYVNMPYNYPGSTVTEVKKEVGFYRLNANLNLRSSTSTLSDSLAVLANGSIIEITEVDGFWGRTNYGGKDGWVFLEKYTVYYSRAEITPSGTVFALDEGGEILKGVCEGLDSDAFAEHFDKQSMVLRYADGSVLSADDYVGTGTVVTIVVNDSVIDTATLCIAGDLNGNGRVDVGDYLMSKRAYMDTLALTELQSVAADVSGDGDVDPVDYLLIKRYFFSGTDTLFAGFY